MPALEHDHDILVVGGGIGGLATALALRKVGLGVTVVEKRDAFTEVGAGLQLAPNATRILASLGLLEAAVATGVVPTRLVFADAVTGEGLTTMDIGPRFQQRYGGPYVVMHRTDLLSILLDACRESGVELLTGTKVEGVESTPEAAIVTLADGTQRRATAVVAADGINSALRKTLSDDAPVTQGFVAYRGALPISQVERPFDLDTVIAWLGPNLHLVQYPLRQGDMYNQVGVFLSPTWVGTAAESKEELTWGAPEELDAAFAPMCESVRVASGNLWRDVRWQMFDREPIATWTQGRLALLGDAAHPAYQYLVQGACQAIEDGVTLAACFAQHADGRTDAESVQAAFAQYAAIRVPRTRRVQETARMWGEMWHVDGVAKTMRNELFRSVSGDDFSHADWLWRWSPPTPTRSVR